ncbi:hypothetical protein [Candidatus Odyssella thessalonicensis]|uniref:hypothetical protein n=1 Tax=Candidatus Odyssella thessalonicensis TaxID=84647 RepID=UPI000225ACA1|nr:hypothetical protein [Candidatus Odyssella thessalonicensis]
MLKWSKKFQTDNHRPVDPLNPGICFESYANFYQPLGLLLCHGFRQNHPSRSILIDLCLQSLRTFEALWQKNTTFRHPYIKNRFDNPSPHTPQLQAFLKNLPQTIRTLEAQQLMQPHADSQSSSEPLDTHKTEGKHLTFSLDTSTEERKKLTSIARNAELRDMVLLNRKINRLSYKIVHPTLKEIPFTSPTFKTARLIEMDKQDQLVNFMRHLHRTVYEGENLEDSLAASQLSKWQDLFRFAESILKSYSAYSKADSCDQIPTLGLITVLESLIPFVGSVVEQLDSKPTLQEVISLLYKLEDVVGFAHHHLKERNIRPTLENLEQAIGYFKYLFQFQFDQHLKEYKLVGEKFTIEDIDDIVDAMDSALEAYAIVMNEIQQHAPLSEQAPERIQASVDVMLEEVSEEIAGMLDLSNGQDENASDQEEIELVPEGEDSSLQYEESKASAQEQETKASAHKAQREEDIANAIGASSKRMETAAGDFQIPDSSHAGASSFKRNYEEVLEDEILAEGCIYSSHGHLYNNMALMEGNSGLPQTEASLAKPAEELSPSPSKRRRLEASEVTTASAFTMTEPALPDLPL